MVVPGGRDVMMWNASASEYASGTRFATTSRMRVILPRFGGHQPKPENGLGQVVHGHEEEEEATVLHA